MRSKYNHKRKQVTPQQPHDNALEIVRNKLRTYVDKYASIKSNRVEYSFYDHKTREATKKSVSLAECKRIVAELYS